MSASSDHGKDLRTMPPSGANNRHGCRLMKTALAALGFSALLTVAGPALAELTQTDVMVASRTVSFMWDPPPSERVHYPRRGSVVQS